MTLEKQFKPNNEVLARLAKAFYENTLVRKTHLHSVSRTDWQSFARYFDWLESNDYIKRRSDGSYGLTDAGKEMFSKLSEFLVCVKNSKFTVALCAIMYMLDYFDDMIDFLT